jgi:hypothetical protein
LNADRLGSFARNKTVLLLSVDINMSEKERDKRWQILQKHG